MPDEQIYGLWHGGSSYSEPELPDDLEIFLSLTDARDAMEDRIKDGYWREQVFVYADGHTTEVRTPVVSGSTLTLYLSDPREVTDPYPDLILRQDEDDTIFEEKC